MTEAEQHHPVPLGRERERIVTVLCEHFAADNLTEEEFESRLDAAYGAATEEELAALIRNLPALTGGSALAERTPAVPRVHAAVVRPRGFQIALLGGSERRGAWTPPRELYTIAVMGGAGLDFREAVMPPGVTEVKVLALMGGVEIIVPPGLGVETHGIGLLGGFDALDQAPAESDREAPRLVIKGLACMGGVEVKVMLPGETTRDARRRIRERRRRLRRARSDTGE
jgi:hypothetical protein